MRASLGDARSTRDRDTRRLREPARRVVHAEVATAPVDVTALEALVADASAGAVVSFGGIVRDHDGGRPVTMIEYVGHPSARSVLEQVAADVAGRTDVEALAVAHRLGPLRSARPRSSSRSPRPTGRRPLWPPRCSSTR